MLNAKFEIVVPSTFGESSAADKDFVASCLDHVVVAFNNYFGGCTVIDGNGCWNNDTGDTIAESVKIVYAYGDDNYESWNTVCSLAEWVKLTMLQSAVLIARSPAYGELI